MLPFKLLGRELNLGGVCAEEAFAERLCRAHEDNGREGPFAASRERHYLEAVRRARPQVPYRVRPHVGAHILLAVSIVPHLIPVQPSACE